MPSCQYFDGSIISREEGINNFYLDFVAPPVHVRLDSSTKASLTSAVHTAQMAVSTTKVIAQVVGK